MRWTPLEVIVAFVAVGYVTVMLTPTFRVLLHGETLPPEGLDLLEKLAMGALAMVSMFIGTKLTGKDDD